MKTKQVCAPKARNEQAAALFARAGNAGQAIAVDTRPKVIGNKRHASRAATKAGLLRAAWD